MSIDIKSLSRLELLDYAEEVMIQQDKVDWNSINYQKEILLKKMGDIKEFRKFARPIPMPRDGRIANYRSWIELYLFEFGALKKARYEPKRFDYFRSHQYRVVEDKISCLANSRKSHYSPDTMSNTNPRVCLEIKGHLTSKDCDRGQKYLDIKHQTDLEIIFVLQRQNILLPWTVINGDILDNGGTGDDLIGKTMEEWCAENGFKYTYYYQLRDYLKSDEYQNLIAQVDAE